MVRASWLGDVLRDAGLPVVALGGWQRRGGEMETIYGVVGHDTVTSVGWTDHRVDLLLRDGHANLKGPLSQLGLDRQGRFRLIASGRCNHNGYGTWKNNAIGIEVYCGGGMTGESWNEAQQDAFVRGSRAILDHLNLGPSSKWNPRVAGHKETDPKRKIDPHRIDMDDIRRRVTRFVTAADVPTFDAPTEDDMNDADRALLGDISTKLDIIIEKIGDRPTGSPTILGDLGRLRRWGQEDVKENGYDVPDGP